jgi:hypothetical protein
MFVVRIVRIKGFDEALRAAATREAVLDADWAISTVVLCVVVEKRDVSERGCVRDV